MSRNRKYPYISEDKAFDAIWYFENTEPRSEEEKDFFHIAVLALQKIMRDEEYRVRHNEYMKQRRATDPEFAERMREYNRKWVAENRGKKVRE